MSYRLRPDILLSRYVERYRVEFKIAKSTEIFYNVTPRGATTMASLLVILAQFCAVTNMTTASRQLFSFARDKGFPFHTYFEKESRLPLCCRLKTKSCHRSLLAGTFPLMPSLLLQSSRSSLSASRSAQPSLLISSSLWAQSRSYHLT